jgi:tetratricopeptide (TPR) repeat protein
MAFVSPAVPRRAPPSWTVPLFLGLIAVAALAAYGNSFAAPFLFDDQGAIVENSTIQHWASALSPPAGGLPVSGRPLVNLSLATNYALSGGRTWSYHGLNLLIHLLAGWTLFGIVRRTLAGRGDVRAAPLAFSVALLWTVHPLQTEAVTYLSQRAESLMGLCYLLTLYGFIRYAEAGRRRWAWVSLLACFAGMASKETMVTAPLLVLLYDRTFLAGGFREAWRRRGLFYAMLGSSWLLLGWLVATTGSRGGTAGFSSSIAWWAYAFTQVRAVAHYLRLCLWPRPLIFDYGLVLGGPPLEMAVDGAVLLVLLGATVRLVARGSPWGFLGAWFFLILAPTSSILPISTEVIAEHRVYLPLAAVVAAVVCAAAAAARRWRPRLGIGRGAAWVGGGLLLAASAGALLAGTRVRNEAYRSTLAFWRDAAEKTPDNPGARNNYGNSLMEEGRTDEAAVEFQASLRLVPDYDDANFNYGNVLAHQGRWAEAVPHYLVALHFRPEITDWRYALGNALAHTGRPREADEQYERALRGSSLVPGVWYNLGNAFLDEGKLPEAEQAYARAIALRPDYDDALVNDAGVLAQLGREPEAVRAFQAALRLEPRAADVHNNLGGLLAETGRLDEAKAEFQEALRLKPDYREADDNLRRVEAMQRAGATP